MTRFARKRVSGLRTLPLRAFARDDAGATAVEYGLLVAGLALALLTVVGTVGTNISGVMNKVGNALH